MNTLKRGDKGRAALHLNDEAPRIGSGFRTVDYKVGNRIVTLRNPYTGRTAKIDRETFTKLYIGERP